MDNFEEYIRTNRDDLDRYEPSPSVWKKISRKTDRNRRISMIRYSSAAAILIIAGLAAFFYLRNERKNNGTSVSMQNQQELRETEVFYNSMFNNMYNEAKTILTSQPVVDKELKEGVAQIDSICADLRKDLKDNVSNREVIEALIRNYRIKIQLLDDMLKVVKQNENDDKKPVSHEL